MWSKPINTTIIFSITHKGELKMKNLTKLIDLSDEFLAKLIKDNPKATLTYIKELREQNKLLIKRLREERSKK